MPVTRFMSLLHLLSRARNVPGNARDVVTLLGDFALGSEKSSFRVGQIGRGRTRHGISLALLPICTAWVRRLAPSLSNSRLEWVFT